MDESNTVDQAEPASTASSTSPADDGYEAWLNRPVPQHTIEAYEAFVADLEELLAHRMTNPDDRWVAYRGRQRLGFGKNQTPLHLECLDKFPDGEFGVFSIGKQPDYENMVTVV